MNESITLPEAENTLPAVVIDQHGQPTALRTNPVSFDVEQYQDLISNAKNLGEMERTVSVVPKYFEFTNSLEEVQKAAGRPPPTRRRATPARST